MLSSSKSLIMLIAIIMPFHDAIFVFVNGSANIYTTRFTCSRSCSLESTYFSPLTYKARSRIECAAECSRQVWCHRYVFLKNENASMSKLQLASKPCYLYMDAGSACSNTFTPAAKPSLCSKLTDRVLNKTQMCAVTSQRVLDVINAKPNIPMGNMYLKNLLTAGNNLKIQFVISTSTYAVSANYYTVTTGLFVYICGSILDIMAGFGGSAVNMFVRSFCNNGSQTVSASSMATPAKFYWNIQTHHISGFFNKEKVFITGADPSALVSAVNKGFDFTLAFLNNSKFVHADVITHNKITNETAAQVKLYENGQLKILTHITGGSTKILTWSPSDSMIPRPNLENSQVTWLSDSCWRFVSNTPTSSTIYEINLTNSIESGRRIRMKITIDDLVILATPDYIGIASTGTVTAYVLRVLVQESVSSGGILGTVTNLLGSADTKPQWTHYIITSSGDFAAFTTDVGSSGYKETSGAVTVQWFEEIQNWTLVHTSSMTSTASAERLAAAVLNGSDVRVKVEVSGNQSWLSCDMVQVTDSAREVKCQVSGQLSVSTSASGSNSLLGGLFSILSVSQSTTSSIRSECYVISASTGSISSFSSCLWPSSVPQSSIPQPEKVEWFVPS